MSDKAKRMCKIAKEREYGEKKELIKGLVQSPRYICPKCLRVANQKEALCHSEEL